MDSIVDKKSVEMPKVYFTPEAVTQLTLIITHDFTLAGKYFRLLISGKGCDGFDYSAGFTDLHDDDFIIPILSDNESTHHVVIDPFAAFYLQNVHVAYKQDFENNNEGFVITNKEQKEYNGKFWKQKPQHVPPTLYNL